MRLDCPPVSNTGMGRFHREASEHKITTTIILIHSYEKTFLFSTCLIALVAVSSVSSTVRVLSKIKETTVSLVQNLLSTQDAKGGRSRRLKSLPALAQSPQTAGIGVICAILFVGLLIAPLSSIESQSSGTTTTNYVTLESRREALSRLPRPPRANSELSI